MLAMLALVLFGVGWRLMPHLPNFAPVSAIALLGGATLSRRNAIWLPLAIMAISDLFIGFYQGFEWTWISIVLVATLGMAIKRLSLSWRISIGAIGGSILFFVVSNFGVWLTSGMYSHTLIGLVNCYTLALPFFRMTLLSDIVFVSVLLMSAEYAVSSYALRNTFLRASTPTTPSMLHY